MLTHICANQGQFELLCVVCDIKVFQKIPSTSFLSFWTQRCWRENTFADMTDQLIMEPEARHLKSRLTTNTHNCEWLRELEMAGSS